VTQYPSIEALADDAWLVQFGHTMDATALQRVHALAARLDARRPAWLRDRVPAYTSLGVFFDPSAIAPDDARAWLADVVAGDFAPSTGVTQAVDVRTIEIPVAYGGAYGPDLADAARELGLDEATLVRRHAVGDYIVAMIGFAPGFPYLAGLDPALALPRLATPRTRVPAGTVAIGGSQTGVYPRDSPGGWRMLGRTPLRLFDPQRDPPALLQPGDRVRFHAIDVDTFERLARKARQ
jgi:KipI family sensor histidine kinase inhibitor